MMRSTRICRKPGRYMASTGDDGTPDSGSIVFWAGGKIRRVNRDGSGSAEIPFQISDTRAVIDPVLPGIEVAPPRFTTRIPRFATVSPDGSQILFESLGRLYLTASAGGTPRPLTAQDGDFQLFPSWSRDGSRIVFVSWNDMRLGEIRTVAADGSDMRAVSQQPGHYRRPRFSPDGNLVVYEASGSGGLTSNRWSGDTGIFRIPAAGGEATRIVGDGGNPHFAAGSDRIFFEINADQKLKLVSGDLGGGNRREHAQGDLVTGYEVAPDGQTLAFRENYNLFVTPFFGGAQTLNIGSRGDQMPVTRVSTAGASYPGWTRNGRQLSWSLGPTLLSAATDDLLRTAPGGAAYRSPERGTSLAIGVAADAPQGQIALVGARIITMADEAGGIIDDAVLLIDGNRIRAVGRRGRVGFRRAQQVESQPIIMTGLSTAMPWFAV